MEDRCGIFVLVHLAGLLYHKDAVVQVRRSIVKVEVKVEFQY